MNCLACRGPLEYAQNGAYARCMHCVALFQVQGGHLVPMQVQAPGGGNNPQFNAHFAQQLGFAPRQASHAAFSAGGFGVKVNTDKLKDEVKSRVIWWLIGAGITLVVIGFVIGLFIWIGYKANQSITATDPTAPGNAKTWDGKAELTCGGNERWTAKGITANLTGTAVQAGGNCEVELNDVSITADTAVSAIGNGKVTIKGGSLKGKDAAASTLGNGTIAMTGTKVSGKTKKVGGTITGP